MVSKRALLIGIDHYDHVPSLSGCVNDACSMQTLLGRHYDGSPNYDCKMLTSTGAIAITRRCLREQLDELFDNFNGDVLFYFSGHGTPTKVGGFLVTQDGQANDLGLNMNDLLTLANQSHAQSVLLVLDCCFSGDLGNPSNLQGTTLPQAQLREGLTILAASRPTESAAEVGGHGVFTKLVIGALSGGAADVRGRVSAAAIYAYVEQALGAWEQRPMYKSHADRLPPVRLCKPNVQDDLLRELPSLFNTADDSFQMDPSFEYSDPAAQVDNVAIFDKFKLLRNARLLTTQDDKDLYFVALESRSVQLTPLGQFYWQLANTGRI